MSIKTAIYKQVLREYDALRTSAEREQRNNRNYVYAAVPEIEAIDKEIAMTGIKIARLVLSNPENTDTLTAQLMEQTTALHLRKRGLLEKEGFPPDILEQKYICPKCKDTGFIGSQKCTCLNQKLIDRAYGQSNLKDVLDKENFDFFDLRYYSDVTDPKEGISPLKNMQNHYMHCINFVNHFNTEFQNLLLYGDTGLGKTFLCNCIAKDLLDAGKTVLYITAPKLFKIIEDERFHTPDEEKTASYLDDVLSVDLFIIDDLGTEFSTILSSSELFNILNTRLLEKHPVIISTNLAPKDLINQYSDRIVSRIMGSYRALKFFGEDIRIKKKFRT